MKKAFVKSVSILLVCIFVILGINFSIFAVNDAVELGETLSGMNVEVSGKISLMLYFKNLDNVAYFEVTVPNRDGSVTTNTVEKDDLKYDSSKDRYLLKVSLAAAQQTDKVRVRAFNENDVGSGKVYEYSIRDYADKIFELANSNSAYKEVAKAIKSMLNYGAMAQEYFDYNTKNLANTDLYYGNTDPIDDMSYSDMYGITEPRSFSTNASIIKFKDATAYLEDTISLRFRFEYNGTACEAEELITVINSVQYKNEVVCDENGDYYILINNIPATRFGTQYQINISDGAGNSAEISYSVLNYLQTRLLSTNDQSMKNVAYSMFQFYVNTSIHVGNAVPGFDEMKASCAHDRTYLDSVGGTVFFICSDCGETEEYVDFIETLDLGYKGEELLNIITDGVNDKGVSAVLCRGEYVRVTSDSSNDRYIGVDLDGEANVGSYMVVRYRTVIAPTKASVQIFATSGSTAITGSNDWFNACGIVADGRWHTLVIDLNESNAVSSGNGRLHHVRLDIFDSFPANAVIDFAYIGFCDSINDIAVASGEYLEYGNVANATWRTSYDVLRMDGVDAPRYGASVQLGPHQSSTLKGHVWLLEGWVAVDDCSITDISVCVVDEKGKEHWTAVTKDGTGSRWSENQGITNYVVTNGYSTSTKGYRIYPTVDLSEYYGQTVSLSVRVITSKGFAVTIYVAFIEVPLGARPGYVSGEELAAGVTSSFSKTVNNDGSITITNTTGKVDGTINITSIIDRTSKYAVVRYKTTDDSRLYIYATSAGRTHTGVSANLKTDGEWHVAYLDLECTSYNPGDAISLFRLDVCEARADMSITIDYVYLCDDFDEVISLIDKNYRNHVDHIYVDEGSTDLKEATSLTGTTVNYTGWLAVDGFSTTGISYVVTDSAGNEAKFALTDSSFGSNIYYKGGDAIQNAVTGSGWSANTVGYVVKFVADLSMWAGQNVTLSIREYLTGGGYMDTYSLKVSVPSAAGTLDAEPAADFTVAKMFSDHMVVQRGEHIRVWGFAPASENGKKVSAEFKGMLAEAIIENGEWCITFDSKLKADAVGATMTIYAGTNKTVTFNDVLVGDVYLVLGQSNAAFSVKENSGNEADIDENSIIRLNFLNGGGGTYAEKGTDYVYKDLENTTLWTKTTKAQADRFSALGYYFAQDMVERSGNTVPVGVMEVAVGGAPLASFLPNDLAELYGSDYYNANTGKYVSMRDASHLGRYLYNCYLAPASRYAVAGVLWYQGESDNPLTFAQVYGDAFGDLIERLRSTHNVINKDFPVFVVEFPTQYQKPADYAGSETWQYLEVGTIRTYLGLLPTTVENCYLSASSDLWSDKTRPNNLHPNCKIAQAERLADIADAVMFGNGTLDEATGPIFESYEISADGKTVVITFSNVGSDLTTADGGTAVKGLLGFIDTPVSISTVSPVSATITAENQVTVVFNQAVKAVVYNYNTGDFYGETLNLCNSARIPALAFITPYEYSDMGQYSAEDFQTTSNPSVGHKKTAIDTMVANGDNLFTPGYVTNGLAAAGNRVSLVEGTSMLFVTGWTGFNSAVRMFGYSIDGGDAIFNAYPSDPGDAVIAAGGQYAKRFSVNIDISDLAAGNHAVDVLVLIDANGGTAVKLLSFTIIVPESESETETETETETEVEPSIPDGYDAPLFNDPNYGIIGESVDILQVDGQSIYTSNADNNLAANGHTLTVTTGAQVIRFVGWMGFETTIDMFGYSVDGAAVIATTPSDDNIQPLINAGKGENVRRYNIYVDISGLDAGYHAIDLLVRVNMDDGSTVVLKVMETFTLVIEE